MTSANDEPVLHQTQPNGEPWTKEAIENARLVPVPPPAPEPQKVEAPPCDRSSLRMTLDFNPSTSDFEKAQAALDASIAFKDLTDAVTVECGAVGKVEWTLTRMVFDGDDAGAQVFFDGLMAAYEKGRAAALSAPAREALRRTK